MPVEMEAKLKVEDHAAVRQRLRDAGAKRAHERLETNLIFDAADGSLFAANMALRLRINHDVATGKDEAVLTFKGPGQAGQFKNREEIETGVAEPKSMQEILEAMGFVQVLSFQKRRESWELDDCKIELDEVPHLGRFVEIEGPSEACITNLQRKLGLGASTSIKRSYVSLLMAWLKERGSSEREIRFQESR